MNPEIAELLLWFESHKKTGRLFISEADAPAELFLHGGKVIHARTQEKTGLEAFLDVLLRWRGTSQISWESDRMPQFQTLFLDNETTTILMSRYAEDYEVDLAEEEEALPSKRGQEPAKYRMIFTLQSEECGQFTYEARRSYFQAGRDASNELAIDDTSISRRHAFLTVNHKTIFVHDLDSTNGTFINDTPIGFGVLHEGQTLRFGSVSAYFTAVPLTRRLDGPAPRESFSETAVIPGSVINKVKAMNRKKESRRVEKFKEQQLQNAPAAVNGNSHAPSNGANGANGTSHRTATTHSTNGSNGAASVAESTSATEAPANGS